MQKLSTTHKKAGDKKSYVRKLFKYFIEGEKNVASTYMRTQFCTTLQGFSSKHITRIQDDRDKFNFIKCERIRHKEVINFPEIIFSILCYTPFSGGNCCRKIKVVFLTPFKEAQMELDEVWCFPNWPAMMEARMSSFLPTPPSRSSTISQIISVASSSDKSFTADI